MIEIQINSNTFFASDHHFGHRKIIEFCDRPCADVDQMNEMLIDAHNRTVPQDATVFFVGDFAMGRIAETLPVISEMNGAEKILVAGNHDRCWTHHSNKSKGQKAHTQYLQAGFTKILDRPRVRYFDMSFQLCHFPYTVTHPKDTSRYTDLLPQDFGLPIICGHTHNTTPHLSAANTSAGSTQINVSVDVLPSGFGVPISISEIANEIR